MKMEYQSNEEVLIPRHLGIILDGNGRWAKARGLPRSAGHKVGIQKIHQITEDCIELGIQFLTLYVFSTENWSRPVDEVNYLMFLSEDYATRELPELQRNGVQLQLMGKRDGLPVAVLNAMDKAIEATRSNTRLILNLALNYGGRDEILTATKAILTAHQQCQLDGMRLNENIIQNYLYCPECPDVDLVIRTSGENRMSNFLLWRAANAVFISSPVFWPDFTREHLQETLNTYSKQVSGKYVSS